MNGTSWRVCALVLVLALLVAACGGGDEGSEAEEEPTEAAAVDEDEADEDEPTEEPTEEATEEATEDVKDVETDVPVPTETATAVPTTEPAAVATTAPPGGGLTGEEAIADEMAVGGETSYASYTTITDDTGAIQVEVPAEWNQVDGRPFTDEQGRQLFDVRAAPDLEGFTNTWDVPGLIVTASTEVAQSENEVTLLDELVGPFSGVCTYLGRQPYDDGLYTGQADVFENCGGTETGYLILGAVPNTRAFVIRVQVQVVAERDVEALGRALASFVITGDV
ncbi:hypothetical protein [Euzebya sp.]|uniref:hypothetical protein n=1 Tax=Euzebya sp. TaxID=1971409 RepID=UPI0035171C71